MSKHHPMTFISKHKLFLSLFFLTLIGGFFRFYNLNWGSPFYFHPDERNIASAVMQLSFPNQMNPHFFAYGSFPIYLIYFTAYLLNLFTKYTFSFEHIIIISRFYSALLSILLIPTLYFLGGKLGNKRVGIIAAIFCTFCTGFIQFAHFGTFEMWLTFLGVWFFYFSFKLTKDLSLKNIIVAGAIFGLLMAIKISSLPLVALPLTIIILNILAKIKILKIYKNTLKALTLISISLITFAVFSPYVFLDFKSFSSSIQYESSVALGTLPVFYTGEFFHSIPIVFQFIKIYPFLLNPIMTLLFVPSFLYVSYLAFKKNGKFCLLLVSCFLLLFIPQAFLFAKWTRYMVPTLPFMYLIIAIALEKLIGKKILSLIIFISIIFASSYFITAFLKQDTRVGASMWMQKNIPEDSRILSEVYDMGIVPFNSIFHNISLFNFYDLDQIPTIKSLELENALMERNYIILPSQRIIKTRILNKKKFPTGNKFYGDLFSEKLSYQKIYETSCDIFCKITYLGDPVFSLEETANVFDRPTIFIFKKN